LDVKDFPKLSFRYYPVATFRKTSGCASQYYHKTMPYKAELLEQAYYCNHHKSNNLIHIILRFDGALHENVLMQAVQLSLGYATLFGCKFVEHWKKPFWEPFFDASDIVTFQAVHSEVLEKKISAYIALPFTPGTDPHIQICLFRSQTDTLAIKLSHMLADATGTKIYLKLLTSLYRKLISTSDTTVPKISSDRSLEQVCHNLTLPDRLKIIQRTFLDQRQTYNAVYTNSTISLTPKDKRGFIIKKIGRKHLSHIQTFKKAYGCTLNDILLTAFSRAIFLSHIAETNNTITLKTRIYADLRRYLPHLKKTTICTLSGTVYPVIHMNAAECFEQTLTKVHKEILSHKNNSLGLGDIPLLYLLFKFLPFAFSKYIFRVFKHKKLKAQAISPVFSNFGTIDSETVSFGHTKTLETIMLPTVFSTPALGLLVSVYDDCLYLCSGTYVSSHHEKVMNTILCKMIEELSSPPFQF